MMTSHQIELLIEQGEGYNLEFKQALPPRQVIWQKKFVHSPMRLVVLC